MSIGQKIKKLRTESGLTQKELADKLHVTYQAVSRWENDDAEPSLTTIKDICDILGCSYNDLLGDDSNPKEDVKVALDNKQEEIKQISQPQAVCSNCNRFIYDSNELHFVKEKHYFHSGKTNRSVEKQLTLCEECYQNKIETEKKEREQKEKERKEDFITKRKNSFRNGIIVAVIFVLLAISAFVDKSIDAGFGMLLFGAIGYCFAATLSLKNSFIPDMWLVIVSFGFVKFPGIIFEASADGLVFLIAMKLLFFVLGMILVGIAVIIASIIAALLSVFVYPFALRKNLAFED